MNGYENLKFICFYLFTSLILFTAKYQQLPGRLKLICHSEKLRLSVCYDTKKMFWHNLTTQHFNHICNCKIALESLISILHLSRHINCFRNFQVHDVKSEIDRIFMFSACTELHFVSSSANQDMSTRPKNSSNLARARTHKMAISRNCWRWLIHVTWSTLGQLVTFYNFVNTLTSTWSSLIIIISVFVIIALCRVGREQTKLETIP